MNRVGILASVCATAAIFAAPATRAQEAKTWLYSPNGTIAGWIVQPEGSSKAYVYDNHGNRTGTIEQLPGGSQKQGIYNSQGVRTGTIAPDPFGSNSADPFAPDDSGE
jgi:hypothetical protein